jgi:hypothetical protein
MPNQTSPTASEIDGYKIRTVRGIELGLGQADPVATIAGKLEALHPGHLIMVQAGTFLHAYDRTAYVLNVLKHYKLVLIGAADDPHIRAGFPVSNFKRRLWSLVDEFGIPYVVSLGSKASERTVYISNQPTGNVSILSAVSDQIIKDVITELKQRGELNKASAKILLTNPDSGFELKNQAIDLDTMLLNDIIRMPRDLRATYGENLRACMARIMRCVMLYGNDNEKPQLLKSMSADVDLLKHYMTQAPRLKNLKLEFEHRAVLVVERPFASVALE